MKLLLRFALPWALLLALCATTAAAQAVAPPVAAEPDEFALPPVSDPFEPVNRALFTFNDRFYAFVLRPVAHGYVRATPPPVQHGLANFFDNLRFPVRFAGDVLAGRPNRAVKEAEKFLINSTAGFVGLVKVSDSVPALQDVPPGGIGTALATWGIGPGPYIVLPLLGASDTRDTVGLAGDAYLMPTTWLTRVHPNNYGPSDLKELPPVIDVIQNSPELLKTYDDFLKSAVDPYLAVRDGYLQFRAAAVKK